MDHSKIDPSQGWLQENLASWSQLPGRPQQEPGKPTGSHCNDPLKTRDIANTAQRTPAVKTASLRMSVTVGLTIRVGIFGFIVYYLFGVCVHAMTYVGEGSEGNLWGLVSLLCVLWVQTQLLRLGSKDLYPLSHHTGSNSISETEFM